MLLVRSTRVGCILLGRIDRCAFGNISNRSRRILELCRLFESFCPGSKHSFLFLRPVAPPPTPRFARFTRLASVEITPNSPLPYSNLRPPDCTLPQSKHKATHVPQKPNSTRQQRNEQKAKRIEFRSY